ncbi:hypothetical protein M8J77_021322 [Diaphorina citri]|nr:hypothetical protein M8J77_021322 [Diaphorina citri]
MNFMTEKDKLEEEIDDTSVLDTLVMDEDEVLKTNTEFFLLEMKSKLVQCQVHIRLEREALADLDSKKNEDLMRELKVQKEERDHELAMQRIQLEQMKLRHEDLVLQGHTQRELVKVHGDKITVPLIREFKDRQEERIVKLFRPSSLSSVETQVRDIHEDSSEKITTSNNCSHDDLSNEEDAPSQPNQNEIPSNSTLPKTLDIERTDLSVRTEQDKYIDIDVGVVPLIVGPHTMDKCDSVLNLLMKSERSTSWLISVTSLAVCHHRFRSLHTANAVKQK